MKAWCSENGFTLDHLKYWLYKGKRSASAVSSPEWMPVNLSESLNALQSSYLQIHIGPARIEIGPGFEPQVLREVIKVLSASC